MIEKQMFAVLDMSATVFDDPFTEHTVESAIRAFRVACQTEGTKMNQFPEDFVLYHVATFDKEAGEITAMKPRKVASATSYVQAGGIPKLEVDVPVREEAIDA